MHLGGLCALSESAWEINSQWELVSSVLVWDRVDFEKLNLVVIMLSFK